MFVLPEKYEFTVLSSALTAATLTEKYFTDQKSAQTPLCDPPQPRNDHRATFRLQRSERPRTAHFYDLHTLSTPHSAEKTYPRPLTTLTPGYPTRKYI